ncbi:MAG: radical SAM protein [Cenarchaeum sp. SB0665_bin_23]|nr:radical SAM protein [Cenarchaeum sp. SB0667_bin_13]MXY61251.1 radical SAM protein [Cenarchaeum sp. SB0665_bin_23]MXZ93192.1 radical SAM protein [Cenarchaeum sp. SB0666_bin_15]MYB46167.1 radical SAM protein [Cenarchaeum sp. SB0662_bin_33]MYC78968.1 radical SAM protein [Cenarchaeum sp. SB0661_bin_35]MYD59397.1 radical SAM protein [Cenarchaeum sp. SB0678_bin_8]MYG33693.1 radical SAM protein [Cenarchaeum sp. SB0677_bin_16]MYI51836.1 radical SAM protein [Cenarchaeum sp. SB0673_bin_9]MYJ27272.
MSQVADSIKSLERAISRDDLSFDDGIELMSANLHELGAVADAIRKRQVGNEVTFTSSYYMNYTNVCAASCQMCAFYRKEKDGDAYVLTPAQIEQRVSIAEQMGATEVHIVGGFHPKLPLEYYEDMMKIIKEKHPALNIKAFTAAEIFYLSKITKNSIQEILLRLRDAGLDTMPGGGAELFHPDVRSKIVRGKCTGQEWLDTIRKAHELGIRSNVTMLYGHVEKPEHVIDHLIKIRDLQRDTNGFITFIPLKLSLDNTELEKDGLVTEECSSLYDLRVLAVSRIMLAGILDNISVYWVAYGKKMAQVALAYGGNDLVGTAFSEEIYRAAGKPTGSSIDELATIVHEIGRIPIQRNTLFQKIKTL